VDEAAMATTEDLAVLSQIASTQGWQAVLVGDHRQLASVGAGGMFAELVEDPTVATYELEGIHRFSAEWERHASVALRERDAEVPATDGEAGRVTGSAQEAEAIEAVAHAAISGVVADRDVLVMAHSRRQVEALNDAIVAGLVERGVLNPAEAVTTSDGREW